MSKLLHRSLEAKLAALDGPEWDSSEEEIIDDVKDTSTKKKSDKKKKKKSSKESTQSDSNNTTNNQSNEENATSNVIYIGHIPPAFEETQILSFFSQFGKITNVKLSRSRRTGNPRGYAFVKFDDAEVASIVAETMSGYFLKGERRLVCHVIPKDKIHPKLFQGAKRNLQLSQSDLTSSDRIEYWQDKERENVNKERSMEGIKKITKRLLSREKKKREQLKMMGIDYDFPGYTASLENMKTKTSSSSKRKVSVDDDENDGEDNVVSSTKAKKAKKVGISEESSKANDIKSKKKNATKRRKST